MLFRVDPASSRPIFEQIAGSVRRQLRDGDLVSGDRLPPAKSVAEALDVNLHTVLRAYQQLREEGLVDLRRGRGAVVVHDTPAQHAAVVDTVRELVTAAHEAGLTRAEVTVLIEEEWS